MNADEILSVVSNVSDETEFHTPGATGGLPASVAGRRQLRWHWQIPARRDQWHQADREGQAGWTE